MPRPSLHVIWKSSSLWHKHEWRFGYFVLERRKKKKKNTTSRILTIYGSLYACILWDCWWGCFARVSRVLQWCFPAILSLSLFYIIPSLSSSFLALLDDTSNHEKCNSWERWLWLLFAGSPVIFSSNGWLINELAHTADCTLTRISNFVERNAREFRPPPPPPCCRVIYPRNGPSKRRAKVMTRSPS